jgi:hypothetical protein
MSKTRRSFGGSKIRRPFGGLETLDKFYEEETSIQMFLAGGASE